MYFKKYLKYKKKFLDLRQKGGSKPLVMRTGEISYIIHNKTIYDCSKKNSEKFNISNEEIEKNYKFYTVDEYKSTDKDITNIKEINYAKLKSIDNIFKKYPKINKIYCHENINIEGWKDIFKKLEDIKYYISKNKLMSITEIINKNEDNVEMTELLKIFDTTMRSLINSKKALEETIQLSSAFGPMFTKYKGNINENYINESAIEDKKKVFDIILKNITIEVTEEFNNKTDIKTRKKLLELLKKDKEEPEESEESEENKDIIYYISRKNLILIMDKAITKKSSIYIDLLFNIFVSVYNKSTEFNINQEQIGKIILTLAGYYFKYFPELIDKEETGDITKKMNKKEKIEILRLTKENINEGLTQIFNNISKPLHRKFLLRYIGIKSEQKDSELELEPELEPELKPKPEDSEQEESEESESEQEESESEQEEPVFFKKDKPKKKKKIKKKLKFYDKPIKKTKKTNKKITKPVFFKKDKPMKKSEETGTLAEEDIKYMLTRFNDNMMNISAYFDQFIDLMNILDKLMVDTTSLEEEFQIAKLIKKKKYKKLHKLIPKIAQQKYDYSILKEIKLDKNFVDLIKGKKI